MISAEEIRNQTDEVIKKKKDEQNTKNQQLANSVIEAALIVIEADINSASLNGDYVVTVDLGRFQIDFRNGSVWRLFCDKISQIIRNAGYQCEFISDANKEGYKSAGYTEYYAVIKW